MPSSDQRPLLRISRQTWDGDDQRDLVEAADQMGVRLMVVEPDGGEWAPDPDPKHW